MCVWTKEAGILVIWDSCHPPSLPCNPPSASPPPSSCPHLPQVVRPHFLPEPLQQPARLVSNQHHAIRCPNTLLHHVCKVPVPTNTQHHKKCKVRTKWHASVVFKVFKGYLVTIMIVISILLSIPRLPQYAHSCPLTAQEHHLGTHGTHLSWHASMSFVSARSRPNIHLSVQGARLGGNGIEWVNTGAGPGQVIVWIGRGTMTNILLPSALHLQVLHHSPPLTSRGAAAVPSMTSPGAAASLQATPESKAAVCNGGATSTRPDVETVGWIRFITWSTNISRHI